MAKDDVRLHVIFAMPYLYNLVITHLVAGMHIQIENIF